MLLECQQPYLMSHVFIIRKIEKNRVLLDVDEPVSQLHKVCFCLKGSESSYLAIVNEAISIQTAQSQKENPSSQVLSDVCAWTLVQAGKTL